MENLPAQRKDVAQRLILDGGSRVSWIGLDTAMAEASGPLAAPPCPLTLQSLRQWLSREHVRYSEVSIHRRLAEAVEAW